MSPLDDQQIGALLARTRVARESATLTRALARVQAEREVPAWLRWCARPAALWTAAGLLGVSVTLSAWLLMTPAPASSGSTDVIATLLGDEGDLGLTNGGVDSTIGVR